MTRQTLIIKLSIVVFEGYIVITYDYLKIRYQSYGNIL